MCIIIHKKCDIPHPTDKVLSKCLETHKDGFGVMWRINDKVAIVKGLYKLPDIKKVISHIPVDTEAAFHFRMATHGDVSAGNCHPFPLISRNDALQKPIGIFDTGLMHNGIIYNFGTRKSSTLSDTMNFVKHLERVTKGRYTFSRMEHIIKQHYGKFIIFTPTTTCTFGDFVEDKELKFSNTTYKDFEQVWGCNNKGKGYTKAPVTFLQRADPIVKEIVNIERVRLLGDKKSNRAEYLGAYGRIIYYRDRMIFAEDGYYHQDLSLVKEDIDYSIIEGEYEGKYLTP